MNKYYELSAPQKAIWLTEQYYKNTNVNNVCGTFYSNEKLDFDLLQKSLNIFLQNNDSFKIKLQLIDGEIKQYFSEMNNIVFDIVDINNEEEQTNLENQIASEIFDLQNSLLFKIILFRYPDNHGGFVINSHHIISDSWTNGLVANNVSLIYDKLKNNEDYFKDEFLSYKAYLQSEADYINSNKFIKDKEYWNEIFSTIPEIATIPSIKETSSSIDNIEARRLLLNIDNKLLNKLKHYCEENKISMYNFFMTVFAVYLGRVSSLDEFVIGTPILNRSNFKEKQTTGMFINTLPLKITLKNNETFLDNLKEIAVNSMSLLRHQKYSFQYILEDLRRKDSSLPKLYNVLYSYQITKMNENEEALNHTTSWTFNKTTTDDLDIHMFEWNEDDSIKIAYDYQIAKYDEKDIKNLHTRILHIIEQVTEEINIKLNNIEIVTPEEKNKILYEFNNTYVDYPKDKTIVDLFEEQVKQTPNNIAVVFQDRHLTYKELNEKANQLSNYLIDHGLNKSKNIGIYTDRNIETIIGILAILKIGKTFVPIDPLYPRDRILHIINSSKLNCILYTVNYDFIDKSNYHLSLLDINFDKYMNYSKSNIISNISSNNNLYIIFTSGSTGKPKGITLSHRNMINLILFEKNKTSILESNSRILQFATMSFDVSYQEIFSSLLSGNELILISDEKRKNVENLVEYIVDNKITTLFIPPAYLQIIIENNHNIDLLSKSVKYIITAGEALSITNNIKKLLETKIVLFNHYGPAETHVATTYQVPKNINKYNSPIGKPINNASVYVLDKNNKLCPPNIVGQIAIGGDCVGNGYIDNSLNKGKFIDNPFDNTSTLYLTGDLGYINSDGILEFVGRKDFQVKINGFRIELDEINKTILTYKNITSCITLVNEINNKKYIFSYYTSEKHLDNTKIFKYLENKLPRYMLPNKIIFLNKLPINHNGKIDRKSLPIPTFGNNDDFIEPTTQVQKKLSDIWQSILNINKISINEDFFNLGGDSLLAIKLISYIKQYFNIDITIKDIFSNSTIAKLSILIEKKFDIASSLKIPVSELMNYYPISSAQKRIYYSCLKDNDNSLLYNIAGGIILDKELDKNKLENCFKQLIKRHSSLRTHFENKKNEIVQIIEDTITFKLDSEETNNNDINMIYANFVKPFDLSKAPLFRTKLIKLENNKELLLLDMHHIISDGISLNILMQELCDLYNDKKLSTKEIEYKDFAVWEQKQLNTKELNNAKDFWVNQFKNDIPLLNMPTVYSRPTLQSFEGSNYFAKLDNNLYKEIINTAKTLNITPYMLMLSVYYIELLHYTSQDDIIVGTPIIGRELPELENLLGMFVNSLPIRVKINNNLTFNEFSKVIKDICTKSFANQTYPFDMLVKELNIKRDTSRNPLFDTMFIYQSEGYPTISFDGIKTQYFIPNNPISKFDLSLEVVPLNNEYSLRFEYCTKLFNEDFIKRFSMHYINILKSITENNNIKICEIDILSEEEKSQILYDFNDTKVDYPSNKTIIDLFEEQVEKTPNKVAIIFENQKLTYRELNEKANKLARFLLANDTNIGDVVSILLDKSIEMIISILGILKIGGTFLPIDVNYPNERIDYILKDSKSNILLTSQELVHKANDTVQVLYIEQDNSYFEQYDSSNINIKYDVDNLAYIMYTSGSTGKPKGVMVTNKNVVRLVKNNKFIKFDSNENILQTGSIVFDACTFEIWGALLNGYKLFIMKKENLLDAFRLKEYLLKNNITTLWLTAPLFNQLCESDPYMFKNVTKLLTGGDVLSPKHINMVRKACPNLTVINGYGPTENTTFSCCFTIDKEYNSSIPIGKPISNSTAYVVSASGKLCPIGIPGELWVGGDGVSKGYLNNKELTDKNFINNPFDEGIIYKTGDLVKWLPDGNIEFIGRIDNQVKVRGFRIELNEINKRILENSFIKEAFTTIKIEDNNKYICSYIVSNKSLEISDLKTYLSRYLPSYMIPTYFIKMKKLPINQNGKVDKNLLPTNFEKNINTIKKDKPTTNEEKKLLEMFKKILNTEDIGILDNFFDLGGDSLTAMKLQIEAISQNINITYSDIFNFPTVKELADSINLSKKHYKTSIQDFSEYDNLLKNNTLDKTIICENTVVGNILLTGVTGFLGAHILDSFIKKENGKIYCLIRGKSNMSAKERLYNVLHFYFENKYDNLVDDRIIAVEGNVAYKNLGLNDTEYNLLGSNISTIIHSAALVKHYGVYKDFEETNVIGTQNIVTLAKQFNTKLLHISTISVSGNNLAEGSNIDNNFDEEKTFDETNFYIGQNLDNLYVRSKFEAERIVFDAIEQGLSASVLRMGNLTSRFSEGKFQQNHFENAFVNRLKSFLQIGVFPKDLLNLYCEFTPIDCCGDAIINIASHFNKNYTVFHLLNEKHVYLDRLFNMLQEIGIDIKLISYSEFSEIIKELLNNPDKKQYVSGIINDLTKDKKLVYKSDVKIESNFTKEFLYKTGFEWPYIDINYINNYFKYLTDIGYFKINID